MPGLSVQSWLFLLPRDGVDCNKTPLERALRGENYRLHGRNIYGEKNGRMEPAIVKCPSNSAQSRELEAGYKSQTCKQISDLTLKGKRWDIKNVSVMG